MDYHVMRKAADNSSCRIAVHLSTPDGVNAGDLSWISIMLMAKSGKSSVPYLGRKFPDEADSLSKGRIIEVVDTVVFSGPGITNAQRRDEIIAHVTQIQTDIEDTDSDLYKQQIGIYDWFGYSENIA